MLPTIGLLQTDSKQALVDIIRYHNREVFPHSRVNVDTINFSGPIILSGKRTRVIVTPNVKAPGYERTAVNSVNFVYNRLDLNEVFGVISGEDWIIEKPITTEKIVAKLKEVVNFKHSKDEFVSKVYFNDVNSFVLEAAGHSLRWYGSVVITFTPQNSISDYIGINYLLGLVNRVFISPINGFISKVFLKGLEYLDIPNSIEGSITKHVLKGLKNRYLAHGVHTEVNRTVLTNFADNKTLTLSIDAVLHKEIMEGHVVYNGFNETIISDVTQPPMQELRDIILSSMEIPVNGFDVQNIESVGAMWKPRTQADVVGIPALGVVGTKKIYFERINIENIMGAGDVIFISQMNDLPESLNELNSILDTQLENVTFVQITPTEWLAVIDDDDPMFYGALSIDSVPNWDYTPVLQNMVYSSDDNYVITDNKEAYSYGPESIGSTPTVFSLYEWLGRVINNNEIHVGRHGQTLTNVYTHTDPINHLSFVFDQNGGLVLVFESLGNVFLRWFDPIQQETVVTNIGPGVSPFIQTTSWNNVLTESELILVYVNSNGLVYRKQLDRYDTEYNLGVPNAMNVLFFGHTEQDRSVITYMTTLGSIENIYTASNGLWVSDAFNVGVDSALMSFSVSDAVTTASNDPDDIIVSFSTSVDYFNVVDVATPLISGTPDETIFSFASSVSNFEVIDARVDLAVDDEETQTIYTTKDVTIDIFSGVLQEAKLVMGQGPGDDDPGSVTLKSGTVDSFLGSFTGPNITAVSANVDATGTVLTVVTDNYVRSPDTVAGWDLLIPGAPDVSVSISFLSFSQEIGVNEIKFTINDALTSSDTLVLNYSSATGQVARLQDIVSLSVTNNIV